MTVVHVAEAAAAWVTFAGFAVALGRAAAKPTPPVEKPIRAGIDDIRFELAAR